RWVLRVDQRLSIPVSLTSDRLRRSSDLVDMPISTEVTLYQGVPRIELRTQVENTAKDHRLRVLIPTRIQTDVAIADAHFGPIRRALRPASPGAETVEQPVGTAPQQAFV